MRQRDLYFISGSPPCWTVMLALGLKQIAYRPKRLDNAKGDQKSPEFLQINPRGQVPVLVEDGAVICETLAVLSYLDATVPAPGLFGATPLQTAAIWQAIGECDGNLRGPVGEISRPLFRGKAQESAAAIQAAAAIVRGELDLLEARLEAKPWLAGETVSAADLAVYPVAMQLARAAGREDAAPLSLDLYPYAAFYPNLAAWCGRIEQLPGYADAYPPHWR